MKTAIKPEWTKTEQESFIQYHTKMVRDSKHWKWAENLAQSWTATHKRVISQPGTDYSQSNLYCHISGQASILTVDIRIPKKFGESKPEMDMLERCQLLSHDTKAELPVQPCIDTGELVEALDKFAKVLKSQSDIKIATVFLECKKGEITLTGIVGHVLAYWDKTIRVHNYTKGQDWMYPVSLDMLRSDLRENAANLPYLIINPKKTDKALTIEFADGKTATYTSDGLFNNYDAVQDFIKESYYQKIYADLKSIKKVIQSFCSLAKHDKHSFPRVQIHSAPDGLGFFLHGYNSDEGKHTQERIATKYIGIQSMHTSAKDDFFVAVNGQILKDILTALDGSVIYECQPARGKQLIRVSDTRMSVVLAGLQQWSP